MKFKSFFLLILAAVSANAQNSGKIRWNITSRNSIVWKVNEEERLPHSDNIEMAGRRVAAIIHYSIDNNKQLQLERDLIYPQLRTFTKTNEPEWRQFRAYFRHKYDDEFLPRITLGDKILVPGPVDSVDIEGKLIFYHAPVRGISIRRTLFPSMKERLFVEKWELTNTGAEKQILKIGNTIYKTSEAGHKGNYQFKVYSDADSELELSAGESTVFGVYFSAGLNDEVLNKFGWRKAENGRIDFLKKMRHNFVLETPDRVLNTLFYFSKIRAAENIFDSKMGLVHSPGGGNYYVGVWANDQIEYSGPFFPFLGYTNGNTAAYNAYKMFLQNIPEKGSPISSSFEMEGDLPCCGKDRGDAAMIAFGASQYALLLGDEEIARELWPLIEWSLEYCHSRRNSAGAVLSDTDEMEGRISTGNANLATSSLYYGGLECAAHLANELDLPEQAALYERRKAEMKRVIENYFGATIEGLKTYRYFDGNTHLRHWICLPLVMGINQRAKGTTKALLDELWTENGVLVELNPESKKTSVFWDRGTLYALRGTFKAGAENESFDKLKAFSKKRLLGEHVPYVIEAYPENNMRHLSAESALYCRIFTEGILGYEQVGFRSFKITPQLPERLDSLSLKNIHVGESELSIALKRVENNIQVKVEREGETIAETTSQPGETLRINF